MSTVVSLPRRIIRSARNFFGDVAGAYAYSTQILHIGGVNLHAPFTDYDADETASTELIKKSDGLLLVLTGKEALHEA